MNKTEYQFFKKIILSKSYKVNDFIVKFTSIELYENVVYVDVDITSQKDVCWSFDSLVTLSNNIIEEVIKMMGGISGKFPIVKKIIIDGDEVYSGGYYITEDKDREVLKIINTDKLDVEYTQCSLSFKMILKNYEYEFYDNRIHITAIYDIPTIDCEKQGVKKTIKKLPQEIVDSINEQLFEFPEDIEEMVRDIESFLYEVFKKDLFLEFSDVYITFNIGANKICGKKPLWGSTGNFLDYFYNLDLKSSN